MRQLFLIVEFQLINTGDVVEVETYHLSNTTVIIVASSNHWQMLKWVDKSRWEKAYLHSHKVSPHKMLIIYKGIVNTVEKLCRHHLDRSSQFWILTGLNKLTCNLNITNSSLIGITNCLTPEFQWPKGYLKYPPLSLPRECLTQVHEPMCQSQSPHKTAMFSLSCAYYLHRHFEPPSSCRPHPGSASVHKSTVSRDSSKMSIPKVPKQSFENSLSSILPHTMTPRPWNTTTWT